MIKVIDRGLVKTGRATTTRRKNTHIEGENNKNKHIEGSEVATLRRKFELEAKSTQGPDLRTKV